MEIAYCWRCRRDVAMFDEAEWVALGAHLHAGLEQVKAFREAHAVELGDVPFRDIYAAALREHLRIAGHDDVRPQDVWHHRRADHGPTCDQCGKPLRTPSANRCAACGRPRSGGTSTAPAPRAIEPRQP